MAGYAPLNISGMESGLVQERQEFILPNDAYPILQNSYVWRERIKRKQGNKLLGRLQRNLSFTTPSGSVTNQIINIYISFSITEATAEVKPGTFTYSGGPVNPWSFTDNGDGTFTVTGTAVSAGSSINYTTGVAEFNWSVATSALNTNTLSVSYFPGLPVMGLPTRELNNINSEQTVAFDQKYAYVFNAGWSEFIPLAATTWNASAQPVTGVDFFWGMNYWQTSAGEKIFWVTNDSGQQGATQDPIRYTDGNNIAGHWVDFNPTIDASGNKLNNCLAMVPFRGRMVVFNTWEGTAYNNQQNYYNRIRWAAIGNPISDVSVIFPLGTVNANAWRSDIRGQGGFLNIPTSQAITSVGFVRDNLVIYCERSTWQLRYTGRTIQPFQIERVNSELGSESTFSSVQFDTSLVTVGDKGIAECDSYKSDRIDIKIPDLVFQFSNSNNGTKRVQGIRNFVERLAYWTYPSASSNLTFPNFRLVYNYENDSWAIFDDHFTALGNFQTQSSRTWEDSTFPWQTANFQWIDQPSLIPDIIGGNQQGYVSILDNKVTNDPTLTIRNITGNVTTPTSINSPKHNLLTGQIIQIFDIPTGTPFDDLNNGVFGITVTSSDDFLLYTYNSDEDDFTDPQLDPSGTYIGGGQIALRDNFSITSKKFNFIEDGQNIQIGYIDILMDTTSNGAISINVYIDYDDNEAVNTNPLNTDSDTFFNSIIPTTVSSLGGPPGSKKWQRVFCPVRGNFITIEYTFSNAQMAGEEQENDVQIDSQIIWQRRAGRLTQI